MTFKKYILVQEAGDYWASQLDIWSGLLENAMHCSPEVADFINSLTLEEALFVESAFGKKHHGEDKRRTFHPWELEAAADEAGKQWRDRAEKLRAVGKAPRRAGGSMIDILRNIMKLQEPIVAIWKDDPDLSPEVVRDILQSQGKEILPGNYSKYASVDFLKGIREKIRSGQALDKKEQQMFRQWKSLAGSSQESDPTKVIGPEDVYRHFEKQGRTIISKKQAELALIKRIKKEVESELAYSEDPTHKEQTLRKRFERAIDRWLKGGWGLSGWHGQSSSSVKGMQQELDPEEGEDADINKPDADVRSKAYDKLPEPYLPVDYHKSQKGRDPEIIKQYYDAKGEPNDLFYDQIAKPACIASWVVVRNAMLKAGLQTGNFRPDYTDRTSFCGGVNDRGDQLRDKFLSGRTVSDIALDVANRLLDYTALPGWTEHEGLRVNTAKAQAARIVYSLRHELRGQASAQKAAREEGQSQRRGRANAALPSAIYSPDEPETKPTLFDPETIERLVRDPSMLPKLKMMANQEQDPQKKAEMMKLIGQIEKKLAAF